MAEANAARYVPSDYRLLPLRRGLILLSRNPPSKALSCHSLYTLAQNAVTTVATSSAAAQLCPRYAPAMVRRALDLLRFLGGTKSWDARRLRPLCEYLAALRRSDC